MKREIESLEVPASPESSVVSDSCCLYDVLCCVMSFTDRARGSLSQSRQFEHDPNDYLIGNSAFGFLQKGFSCQYFSCFSQSEGQQARSGFLVFVFQL